MKNRLPIRNGFAPADQQYAEGGAGHYGGGGGGFTLIELLTVISIIGLVAGLLVGLAPSVQRTMKTKRVQAQLNQLVMAIENFRAKYGHYPPDTVDPVNQWVIPGTNQLYYELTGWSYSSVGLGMNMLVRNGPMSSATVQYFFHRGGFENSALMTGPSAGDVQNFLPNWKTNELVAVPLGASPKVELLRVPVEGPNPKMNTWNYVSTSPTNNPGKFDLWAVIVIGKQTNVIGNWKQ